MANPNSTTYCATRSLYGLALEGKAPSLLKRCSRSGVPYVCVTIVLCFGGLAFLQVSHSAAVVLTWFTNLVTASQLINFAVIAFTYIKFKKACEAQGLLRDSLPHKAPFQPFAAWVGLIACSVVTLAAGYSIFIDDNFNVPDFLFQYMMVGVFPLIFGCWKVWKGTKWLAPHEVDLTSGVWEIEEYTAHFRPDLTGSRAGRLLDKIFS